jgi:hypothetical protein
MVHGSTVELVKKSKKGAGFRVQEGEKRLFLNPEP